MNVRRVSILPFVFVGIALTSVQATTFEPLRIRFRSEVMNI